MKKILLGLPIFLAAAYGAAQQVVYTTSMAENNAKAWLSNNGTFFRNYTANAAGYMIPKNSNRTAIYMMNIAMIGEDVNGQLKGALSNYDLSDFQPGPIANNYSDPAYQANFGASLWIISKDEIEDHQALWNTQGYIAPANILQWPGNGNTANGEAAQLAPFFDEDGDGLYEPLSGDYPLIRGSYAAYTIVNDDKVHPSGSSRIGMEMHLMMYQYADSSEAVNNTTFVHARLYNRSTQTLYNFKIGSFIDYDLGNYSDDYVGCDSLRNLSYCYNGDLLDENAMGSMGYGEYPPAVGIRYLNQELHSHFVFSNSGVNNPNPSSPLHMSYMLSGYDQYGAPVVDAGGQPTRYMYNDISANGWNEYAVGNPPGDRRAVIGITPVTLQPQSDLCVDFAVVYATNPDSTLTGSVLQLQEVADAVQDFYDAKAYACELALSVPEMESTQLTVYPNPATTVLYVGEAKGVPFLILSTDGKIVGQGTGWENSIRIDHLKAGYYLLVNEQGGSAPFVKQ